MNKCIYSVIGGDERFWILAQMIAAQGATVFAAGFDSHEDAQSVIKTDAATAAAMADAVILPLPATKDGVAVNAPFSHKAIRFDDALLANLQHKVVFAGFADRLKKHQPAFEALEVYDYSNAETFLLRNAQATAEAALMLAIEHLPTVLAESRVLITGCGRIGKYTAVMLRQLGAQVCGASRSADNIAFLQTVGAQPVSYPQACERAGEFDLIINTADAIVVGEQMISGMKHGAVIIDLASYPGGTDFDAAAQHGIKAIHALGLPGKYSPVTAARIIWETISGIKGERHN